MRTWRYWLPVGLLLVMAVALTGEGLALAHLVRREGARPGARAAAEESEKGSVPEAPRWWRDPFFAFDGTDPFADGDRLAKQMRAQMDALWTSRPRATGPALGGGAPQVSLKEEPDRYVLELSQPHLAQAQVKVDAQSHAVTLRIERKAATSSQDGDRRERREERQASVQSFGLAHAVDSEHMKVEQHGDALTVTLPKAGG